MSSLVLKILKESEGHSPVSSAHSILNDGPYEFERKDVSKLAMMLQTLVQNDGVEISDELIFNLKGGFWDSPILQMFAIHSKRQGSGSLQKIIDFLKTLKV